jgi:hypothetical protein
VRQLAAADKPGASKWKGDGNAQLPQPPPAKNTSGHEPADNAHFNPKELTPGLAVITSRGHSKAAPEPRSRYLMLADTLLTGTRPPERGRRKRLEAPAQNQTAGAQLEINSAALPSIRVLAPCPDREVLELRREILVKAGFAVSTPSRKDEAVAEAAQPKFDVLLLCHRWPAAAVRELTRKFKQANRGSPIVAIIATPWSIGPPLADATISGVDGPEAMIAAIRQCTQRRKAS